MIEAIQALKPLVDLGVTALLVGGLLFIVLRPPKWLIDAVASHRLLAEGVKSMSDAIKELPRRDEFKFQDLLIGQELILRELTELKARVSDGRRAG